MTDAEMIQNKEAEIAQLTEQIASLTQQLDWFKRQLFGRKSEKQIEPNPFQSPLFEAPKPAVQKATQTVKAHQRKSQKQRSESDINDTGLRFDETVPREVINVEAPELTGEDADQYEVIDYKETSRLAQRPGSYVILKYVRQVIKRRCDQTLHCPPAPAGVFEGARADVSFVAGMVVDKLAYHLPLYRQHQRLRDAGIEVSRAWLTQIVHKTGALLAPIAESQLESIRQSRVKAMDETPIKAGPSNGGWQGTRSGRDSSDPVIVR